MKKECPLCQKELDAQVERGVTKYICDCTGSPRVVIEVLPDIPEIASGEEQKRPRKDIPNKEK